MFQHNQIDLEHKSYSVAKGIGTSEISIILLPFTKHTWHTDLSSQGTLEDDAVEVDSSDIAESETSISIDEQDLRNKQIFDVFQ